MASVAKQYVDEIEKQYGGGYRATWLPGVPLSVGDIGVLVDGVFERRSSIKYYGIEFNTLTDKTSASFDYASQKGVEITIKMSGEIAPPGSILNDVTAGIIVEISHANSVLFKANNTKNHSVKDINKLEKDVIKLYKEKKWEKEWCIITELVVADSATIIMSGSENSKIELEATADIGIGEIDIADATLGLAVRHKNNVQTEYIAEKNLTPLFRVKQLKFKNI